MKCAFYYSPVFLEHKPLDYHPENPKRLEIIFENIKEDPYLKKIQFIEPDAADDSIIELNHSPDHVKQVKNLKGYGNLDPDTYYSPMSSKAAFLAVGAGIKAVDDIVSNKFDRAFCLVRPPGHHAEYDRAMGFCLFNNAAVTARYALKQGFSKIAIIDWDAHHGNGTQNAFYDSKEVLYTSLHHYPFYPGTGSSDQTGTGKGECFTINIPFSSGANDADYKLAFDRVIIPVINKYEPDLLIISAGYDGHMKDPLGGLSITEEGFSYMARSLQSSTTNKIILFLEGGYDLASLSSSALKTFAILADKEKQIVDSQSLTLDKPKYEQAIKEVLGVQKKYWEL